MASKVKPVVKEQAFEPTKATSSAISVMVPQRFIGLRARGAGRGEAGARGGQLTGANVQCAGITGRTGIKAHEVDPANFDAVMAVNARGIFLGCRAVLPAMAARGYGRIVNIASVAGKEGNAGMVAYSASKGAVIALTKTVGKDYAETGITCNAVAPAVVRTAMVDAMPEEQVKYMTDKIPMKRCGTIAEIAGLVAFIASPEAAFTTGFTFDATGGRATY